MSISPVSSASAFASSSSVALSPYVRFEHQVRDALGELEQNKAPAPNSTAAHLASSVAGTVLATQLKQDGLAMPSAEAVRPENTYRVTANQPSAAIKKTV